MKKILILLIVLVSCENKTMMVPIEPEVFGASNVKEVQGMISPIKSDWDYITEAIIQVESGGEDSAINKDNVGCLQLSSWYVNKANEIGGANYSLNDRFNREKSIEIFNIMNDSLNKDKSLIGACKLHNPKAPKSYYLRVKNLYEALKQEDSLLLKSSRHDKF